MAEMDFKLDVRGLGKLLKSKEAQEMTRKASDRYEGSRRTFVGFDRAKTMVYKQRGRK